MLLPAFSSGFFTVEFLDVPPGVFPGVPPESSSFIFV
jgi:hypothetical protein